jgi:hypothetical protein
VGLIGAIGALVPIIFGGREITYVLSGDRFSYPGAVSASIFLVGLISFLNRHVVTEVVFSIMVFLSILTQFSNNAIYKLNYLQTNNTWWQLAWRIPQIVPTTMISGNIEYGMNDEDYTFWGPANLIYYPTIGSVVITSEILSESTLPHFIAREHGTYSRKNFSYEHDFRNLLIISKVSESCVHLIDGKHPEFSEYDAETLREAGKLSDLSLVDIASSFNPQPRIDLFGPEPDKGWCYYYQKAQLERQQGNWQKIADYGHATFEAEYYPSDPMEWLVFLQAFSYMNDTLYTEVKKSVQDDAYTQSQACIVFASYTGEMALSEYGDEHSTLLKDICQ